MSAEATYAVRASPLVGSSVGGEGREGTQGQRFGGRSVLPQEHDADVVLFVRAAVGSHSGVSSENRSHLSLFGNRRKKKEEELIANADMASSAAG